MLVRSVMNEACLSPTLIPRNSGSRLPHQSILDNLLNTFPSFIRDIQVEDILHNAFYVKISIKAGD